MGLEAMSEAEYRALDAEGLEKRKNDVIAALQGELSTNLDNKELRIEVERVQAEFRRRNDAVALHNLRAAKVAGGAGVIVTRSKAGAEGVSEDWSDAVEYRTAFMDYVTRGTAIPVQYRENANTMQADVAAVIPQHLVNKIYERMDHCGNIMPLVTKTSIAAGILVPTSTVKPVATWVAEGVGSDKQKKTVTNITFSVNKLRCEISITMEAHTMALPIFEAKFVENVSKAMVKAIESAMLAGDGEGKPTGILTQEPAATVTCAKADVSYADICAVEAEIAPEFEGEAKWCMTKKQFMKFVAMTDDNGQPIARINYGINGKPEYNLLGREVVIHSYATEMGKHLAFVFAFGDYLLNTVYNMGIQKKQDWDTEDLLTKAVLACDGKPVDNGSLIVLDAKPSA